MPDIHFRVNQLEKDMQSLNQDVKKIMENHLPHINNELMRLNTTMKIMGGLILAGITALILQGLVP